VEPNLSKHPALTVVEILGEFNMIQKVNDRLRLWGVIENVKDYILIFIVASILLFLMLSATTEGQVFHIILLFSIFFAFVLTLVIWAYRKFQEEE